MKVSIEDISKINVFIHLCNLLKKSNSFVIMIFKEDHLYIQGIDKSHICLYEIKILSCWFTNYEIVGGDETITVDLSSLYMVLSIYKEGNDLIMSYDKNNEEELIIIFDKDIDNKIFSIPTINMDTDYMSIPENKYSVEINIKTKKIYDLTNQLLLFGDNLNIECFDEKICLNTSGEKGKMNASLFYDDLVDYNLDIEEDIQATFSLNTINKMCLSTYLTENVSISISDLFPMKIKYELIHNGTNQGYIEFYIAPKINDN